MPELSSFSPSTSTRTHADLSGPDLWIDTDHQGRILKGSTEALSVLLGYSARTAQALAAIMLRTIAQTCALPLDLGHL